MKATIFSKAVVMMAVVMAIVEQLRSSASCHLRIMRQIRSLRTIVQDWRQLC